MSFVSRLLSQLTGLFGHPLGVSLSPAAGVDEIGRGSECAAHAVETSIVSEPSASARAPEVAGYEKRIEIVDYMLARRLASVAQLNSKVGRKPRVATGAAAGAPMKPISRIGAKKQRSVAVGARVMRPMPIRRSAEIIVFPTGDVRAAAVAKRTARAA